MARRSKRGIPGAARRAAHCTILGCVALSGWASAAQDNLIAVGRHDTEPVDKSSATSLEQQVQRSTSGATKGVHVVQTGQRNLLATKQVPSATDIEAPASASAASRPGEDIVDATANASHLAGTDGASVAGEPDERPLWQLLHDNRLAEYDRSVAALIRSQASWRPSQALAAERARRQQDADIVAALNGDAAALRLLIARAPDEFGCAHIDRVWKAADVFASTGHADEIAPLYRTVIPACEPDANRIATLYRAEQTLPAAQADALIELEAAQGHRDAQAEAAFQLLRYQRAIAGLGAQPPASDDAATRLAALASDIRARHDGAAATLAGWISLAHHQNEQAAGWFNDALTFAPGDLDATLGLAQVRIEDGEYDAAQALLEQPALQDDSRARQARARIALARANAAYQHHEYEASLQWLAVAEQEGMPAEDTDAPRGWNLYALGRYAQAAAAFRAQYACRPDDDSAQGLALSISAMKHGRTALPDAASTGDARIASWVKALDAQQLYYNKQFIASESELRSALAGPADPTRIAATVPADLTGIDAASVAGGLTWSDHIGESGQGRLNTIAPTLRGEWISGTTQFELRYRQLFLDAGSTSLGQTVPGLANVFAQNASVTSASRQAWATGLAGQSMGGTAQAEELQGMMADSIRLGDMPGLDWTLSLGATQGAPTGFQPNVLGTLSQETSWGMWSVHAGQTPVRDSLLSWRGMTLPDDQGGGTWGGVRRAALGAQARWQVAPRWNVSASIEGQWLTGMNVAGNEGMTADAAASYDLRVPGFDYFSVGPAMHYLSYRRNENFYAWGQGGYYSPQSSVSSGVALQWLSEEGRRWQWQGNLETGWNNTAEHSQPCFPNGLNAGLAAAIAGVSGAGQQDVDNAAALICSGSRDSGIYAHAQLSAVIKLSSRWQAGALVDANVTPGRDKQFAALAFVRYFFAPRAAVFSRDLSRNTRDFYMQLDDSHN